MVYFIMGVSGSGKTSIGIKLAEKLAIPFLDGDDFHPAANITKMKSGIPLQDEDRIDWLVAIGRKAKEFKNTKGVVIACSALKEKYRNLLEETTKIACQWIFLNGSYALIEGRLKSREGHFMPAHLLQSQFDSLEIPRNAYHVAIDRSKEEIVSDILTFLNSKNNMEDKSTIGIIGLGVMGKSLSLNIIEKGYQVSLYNRHVDHVEEKIAEKFIRSKDLSSQAKGFDDLKSFVASLKAPRKILMMIKAGDAVDALINKLLPLLEKEDVIIDGGNEHYSLSNKRSTALSAKGMHYLGCGISGGEEGARKGPSIMPGGNKQAYDALAPILEKMAAKDVNGHPCCTYIGEGGAGHFVKMVHNGIEYAEMQLIAEAYQLLRFVNGQNPDEIAEVFSAWNETELKSYLLEISIDILRKKEGDQFLIDLILDKSGNKGTGSWTTIAACELGVPIPMISAALFSRYSSSRKETRMKASESIKYDEPSYEKINLESIKQAYQLARLINHHQGFELITAASKTYDWDLNLSEIARIWTNGCIIRSTLMESLVDDLKNKDSLLLHKKNLDLIRSGRTSVCHVLNGGMQARQALPCFSAALSYLDAYFQANSSANIIQAQRDYFGAHTYQRLDDASGRFYHSDWKAKA